MNAPNSVSAFVALAVILVTHGALAQVPTWTVSADPSLSIGSANGSDEDILLRVAMATRLSDGTIVLQNNARETFEIRYYDSTGTHLHTASRFGRGPYEFRYPLGVYRLPGDSVFVAGQDDRFAVFGPRGERIREGRMGLLSKLPGAFSWGFSFPHLVLVKSRGMPPLGTQRTVMTLVTYDLQTDVLDSVTVVRDRAAHREAMTQSNGFKMYSVPFARETFVAAGAGTVWVGDTETELIRGYRYGSSSPAVTIRSPFEPRSVSRGERSRTRDAYASRFSGEAQQRWARYARSMEFPERMPSFGQLKVDVAGNLWVQEYEPFWAEGDQHWAVFDPNGREIAVVAVPAAALPPCARRVAFQCSTQDDSVLEIGEDYMLVGQLDELGVPYLRKFQIRKGEAPAF